MILVTLDMQILIMILGVFGHQVICQLDQRLQKKYMKSLHLVEEVYILLVAIVGD